MTVFFLFLMCCACFKLVNVQICQDISSMDLNSGSCDLVLRIITIETRDRWSALLIFVDHYLGWITALVAVNYLQFACFVKFCGSLLWPPILPIQSPDLPTPHRKWFIEGMLCDDGSWWLLAGKVPAHRVAMEPPCSAWYFCEAHTNL